MTTEEQSIKPTLGEQITELYSRVAKLNDTTAALLNPNWGANAGILPEDHPLYPKELEPLPGTIARKPRLLDCGWCYEENGEEVHPHPECPIGYNDDDPQEQGAPVDWQAIAKQRERELKTVGEARHKAEAAIARVRTLAEERQTEAEDGTPTDADTLWPSQVLAAIDQPAAPKICELPHQTIEQENACEQQRLAALHEPTED